MAVREDEAVRGEEEAQAVAPLLARFPRVFTSMFTTDGVMRSAASATAAE